MSLFLNAIYLAWSDTRARYSKSVLGPFWITLMNLIGVLGLSVVWSRLLHEDPKSFIPSVAIGLLVWQLISGVLVEAPPSFVRYAHIIRNVRVPLGFLL